MDTTLKTFFIWFFAFLFTAAIAVYQRMTGPTYPIKGKIEIGSQPIKYQLITSSGEPGDAPLFLTVPDRSIKGQMTFKRYKSNDSLSVVSLHRVGNYLVALIPHQPPAGKIAYMIELIKDDQLYQLSKKEVVIRFKGAVPAGVLIPHIFFIFLAMMLSTITGLEAIFKGKNTLVYTWITIITLFLGGLVLGPIIQKFSLVSTGVDGLSDMTSQIINH